MNRYERVDDYTEYAKDCLKRARKLFLDGINVIDNYPKQYDDIDSKEKIYSIIKIIDDVIIDTNLL